MSDQTLAQANQQANQWAYEKAHRCLATHGYWPGPEELSVKFFTKGMEDGRKWATNNIEECLPHLTLEELMAIQYAGAILMDEEWRDIAGFPGYQVSDQGRMRSNHKGGVWKLLKRSPRTGGYLTVSLYDYPAKKSSKDVHDLVLETFVGLKPVGMEARHLNSDRTDNYLTNLRWATHAVNIQDKVIRGSQRGSKNPQSKLNEAQVLTIRKEYHLGDGPSLADKYDVSNTTIWRVVTRQSWRHVE
jgi:hypothetical protein